LAIGLIIIAAGAVSGAHINPAVTISMAIWRQFPISKVGPFIIAQPVGAFLGSALLYGMFGGVLSAYEKRESIVRGEPGSERSAMVFGEYFPNPGIVGASDEAFAQVTELQAMLAEFVGTGLLVFFVFALIDPVNRNRPIGTFAGVFIGMAVCCIVAIVAPLTQAGLNPARDFGPRLFAYFNGWGNIAKPGPRGGFFTVYILSPILGGIVGGAVYDFLIRLRRMEPAKAN
jgi:glycerol uptake facilitator protein